MTKPGGGAVVVVGAAAGGVGAAAGPRKYVIGMSPSADAEPRRSATMIRELSQVSAVVSTLELVSSSRYMSIVSP